MTAQAPAAQLAEDAPLLKTPLYDLHLELGAKMVPFAGYAMPVQYPAGVLKEHLHTRAAAGLFDVSHMGQVMLEGPRAAFQLEQLVPGDIVGLKDHRLRYSLLLNKEGGIIDDLMITCLPSNANGEHLWLVLNAACKANDIAHLKASLPSTIKVISHDTLALLALQGPKAAQVMAALVPAAATMPFMSALKAEIKGIPVMLSRSGYAGEDGFEISLAGDRATELARLLLAHPDVAPVGLGARDSLRLEAGLPLYGHDIDTKTNPVEACLAFAISKRRRESGGFPGAESVMMDLVKGPKRMRVGIRPEGRAPAREGTPILSPKGEPIGQVTSGGFGPTADGPIAMGYVPAAYAMPGAKLLLEVRGKQLPAAVTILPFVAHRYFRG